MSDEAYENPASHPKRWGGPCWHTLYTIAALFEPETEEDSPTDFYNFFFSLANVLPCVKCRQHFKIHLERNPPNVASTDSLFEWVFTANKTVNARTPNQLKGTLYDFRVKYGLERVSDQARKARAGARRLPPSVARNPNTSAHGRFVRPHPAPRTSGPTARAPPPAPAPMPYRHQVVREVRTAAPSTVRAVISQSRQPNYIERQKMADMDRGRRVVVSYNRKQVGNRDNKGGCKNCGSKNR